MPRLFIALVVALSCRQVVSAPPSAPDFDRTVGPLLAQRCLACHSGSEPAGGWDLARRESAFRGGEGGRTIVPGRPDESPLWRRVRDGEMPPKKPLPEAERTLLREWIAQGAAWGSDELDPFRTTTVHRAGYDWWAFRPLQRSEPPQPRGAARVRSEIDAFLLARLERDGLTFSPEAPPRETIRRLSFDLTGLPPSPELVAAFEARPDDAHFARLVDDLLASPRYGEHWARRWLDVARFGESDGFERNNPRRNAWPYRDWVVRAWNEDLPYDEFVRRQIAGDVLGGDPAHGSPADGAAAVGFLVAGVHNTVVGSSPRMQKLARQDELEEIAGTLGQAFLGLTVNCARCHDHKFDPVPQADYYRLVACLDGVRHGERDVRFEADPQRLAQVRKTAQDATARLEAIEDPARKAVLAARGAGVEQGPQPPRPIASWSFDADGSDAVGTLHATLKGGARIEDGALVVDGRGHASTGPLPFALGEKTLEARVRLDDLGQQGGAAISVQTLDGRTFDALVFAEREPGRWMAGSDFFRRTANLGGPGEEQAAREPVHVALVYAADGTISAFRNGQPYGKPYRPGGPVRFAAGQAQVLFGLRHAEPGSNRMLKGRILSARIFDRALTAEEVAAASRGAGIVVAEANLVARLSDADRRTRTALRKEIESLRAEEARLAAQSGARRTYTVVAGAVAPTRLLRRGDIDQVGAVVPPGALVALAKTGRGFDLPVDATDAQRRTALARWMADDNEALASRVIVNRVWHHLFGTGLVETPNDFGFNGGRPSHPELLDRLASDFVADGRSLKRLVRRMVTSTAYRQSSRFVPEAARLDAGNRLLWRRSPRRLAAEELRDALLLLAGRLDLRSGGPGFEDVSAAAVNGTTFYAPTWRDDPALNRRTIWRFSPRGDRGPLLETFDCPDPSTTVPRRSSTTSPLQALALLNDDFVLTMAGHLGRRAETERPGDVAGQVERIFLLVLTRRPEAEERAAAVRVVERHGPAALARALFNASEFVVLP